MERPRTSCLDSLSPDRPDITPAEPTECTGDLICFTPLAGAQLSIYIGKMQRWAKQVEISCGPPKEPTP